MTASPTPSGGRPNRGRALVATPRSRGAVTGLLLMALGAWGALIPFVGPAFHYAYSPDRSWTWTAGRFWLELLPGVATAAGGLFLFISRNRITASFGGWLAAAAGAWFVVGPALSPLWRANFLGAPVGGKVTRAVEQVGLFYGLGAAIILLAAFALGRFSVVSVRDAGVAQRRHDERQHAKAVARPKAEPADMTETGDEDRDEPQTDSGDGQRS